MIHLANKPLSTNYPGYLAGAAAGVAIMGALAQPATATPLVEQSRVNNMSRIETMVDARLDRHLTVPTANGTLTYTVEYSDPYTGDKETQTITEENPLVGRLDSKTPLKGSHLALSSGKYAFGYIDVMQPDTTTEFMRFKHSSMKFKPAKDGPQIRWVKFPDTQDGSRLDFGQPLKPNGKQYINELFGIAAVQGSEPSPYPPQQ